MEQTLILEEKLQLLQKAMARHREKIMDGTEDILTVVSPMLDDLKLSLVLNDK